MSEISTPPWWAPQSNQRGIETRFGEGILLGHLLPQSNQRGIETTDLSEIAVTPDGLNRTSVGLKPPFLTRAAPRISTCLNRTSVGLKPQYQAPSSRTLGWASIEPAWD